MRSIRVGLCVGFLSCLATPARAQAEDSPPSAAFPDLEAPPPGSPPVAPPAQAAVTPVPERHRDEALGAPPLAPRDASLGPPAPAPRYVALESQMNPSWATSQDRPAPAEPTSRWYGEQTLAMDGIALGLVVLGGRTESVEVAGIGGLVYLLAAPTVHSAHGRGWVGLASGGMRLVTPVLGLWVGAKTAENNINGGVNGLALGALAAIVVDAAVLAYEPPPEPVAPRASFTWTPTVAPTERGAVVGVAGLF